MQFIDDYGAKHYNGFAVRTWLCENIDLAVYIAGAYLAFVFWCADLIVDNVTPKLSIAVVKKIWMVWNLALSLFSIYGVSRVGPVAVHRLRTLPFAEAICTVKDEEIYTSPVGFALGLFAISKLPEFVDTAFLILTGKRKLPFLSWFHHVTTFLFAWYAYAAGSSIFIYAATMNYFVHSIMYMYFAMAEGGLKHVVKPIGMYITLLQIAQMVGGLVISGYAVYLNTFGSGCEGTSAGVARAQLTAYIFNFYLFSEMFVKGYLLPKPQRSSGAADAKPKKKAQ